MAFGLYLHIPYCEGKCFYCDFYSRGNSRAVPEEYIEALLREMRRFCNCDCASLRPDTLYFGGGTPSLLTPGQAARLISEAAPAPGAEITLEANPGTVTLGSLRGYRRAGVNRLSVGVQSASDEQLRRLGRPHDAAAARRALQLAREAGFENISGDVMLALPHYSRAEFDATLELLVSGGVTHISCYLLKIEPKTRFGLHPPQGLPDADAAADFYLYAVERLAEAGFAQYEISNFARPGCESRHNLIYWNCGDYLGLGPAAYSSMGGERFHYPPDLGAFLARAAPVETDGRVDAEDYIMLQTRLCSGLSLAELRRRFGVELDGRQEKLLAACCKAGLCRLSDDRLTLTPRGMLVQNSILTEVF
ncbi:radical SAM family heme chaperone HemW [Anaerofilum sp. BX8]|uniref:Heme chaperone HemW n=1 Tax=Anaerofilum hominis TaxID=2763016 RepID=A0A923IEV8_9FIRM|nr:radical SAM family heme chaperone HemW [Anaerofilum hominis]MBC5581387.1 radical SAM family heme chaperone HemW [Anaerofilum hominis]